MRVTDLVERHFLLQLTSLSVQAPIRDRTIDFVFFAA